MNLLTRYPSAFGTVFAARDKKNEPNAKPLHYAVKVTEHESLAFTERKPIMGLHRHKKDPRDRYVPVEALIMFFLSGSNRFPHIDTVYTHGTFQAIVMSASIDYSSDRSTKTENDIFDSKFLAYNGANLIHNKEPRLSELEVCKVASQLLEAMVYLMDMNLSHHDLSHHNYVLEKDLDVSSFASESSFCLLHLYRGIALPYRHVVNNCLFIFRYN
jgi:serine/threonine protein kinase